MLSSTFSTAGMKVFVVYLKFGFGGSMWEIREEMIDLFLTSPETVHMLLIFLALFINGKCMLFGFMLVGFSIVLF